MDVLESPFLLAFFRRDRIGIPPRALLKSIANPYISRVSDFLLIEKHVQYGLLKLIDFGIKEFSTDYLRRIKKSI